LTFFIIKDVRVLTIPNP